MIIVDAYCGAGGAGMGYKQAGFTNVGIDIEPQPDYPGLFHQGDALEALATLAKGGELAFSNKFGQVVKLGMDDIHGIHTSPPCQASTTLTKGTNKGREYVNLIPETRELLALFTVPTIMENVQGSDLRKDLVLCGEMFGLGVIRHRYFELSNFAYDVPAHIKHRGRVRGWRHGEYFDGPYLAVHGEGGGKGTVAEWQVAMGIDWTSNRKSIAEAIPPAYTRYIGGQVMRNAR